MKILDLLKQDTKKISKDQSGQTFVEFVLLLLSIVIVAFSFMRASNLKIAEYWTAMATIILEDDSQTLTPR